MLISVVNGGIRSLCVVSPLVDQPAERLGSSPGQDGADRSALPPREQGESPPAAVSRWLPPPPRTPPLPGSAAERIIKPP